MLLNADTAFLGYVVARSLCSCSRVKGCIDGLYVLPSHIDLVGAELELMNMESRETVMKKMLADIRNDYDYILIDCSPSLGLITVNSLTA